MGKSTRPLLLGLGFLILFLVGLYTLIRAYPIESLLYRIEEVGPAAILLLLGLNGLVVLIGGMRLKALLSSVIPGTDIITTSRINVISLALNYASMGKLNAPAKAALLKSISRVPISASAPVLVAEQALDLASLLVLGLIGVLIGGPLVKTSMGFMGNPGWTDNAVFVGAAGLMMVVAAALVILAKRRSGFLQRVGESLQRLRKDGASLKRSLFYTMQIDLLCLLVVGVALASVGLEIHLWLILILTALPVIAGLLTPIPGGLGVREFVFASIYAVLYGDGGNAVLAAVLIRVSFFISLPLVYLAVRFFARLR